MQSVKRYQPERAIQSAILQYLQLRGHLVWRNVNRGFKLSTGKWIPSAVVGVPDIIGLQKGTGKFIGIEVKANRNKLTEAQSEFLEHINSMGGIGLVAYSVDDVMNLL